MHWLTDQKIPLGKWIKSLADLLLDHGAWFFDYLSEFLKFLIEGVAGLLLAVPSLALVLALAGLAFWLHRSWKLVAAVVLLLLLVINLGYWETTVQTFTLILFSTVICVVIGVPVGIAAAHRPWLYNTIRPVLDLMQTIPTFVYLIPTMIMFGLGVVPGLISTVIFAIPAPIRLTHLGVSGGAAGAHRGRRGVRGDSTPTPLEGGAAARPANHHGGSHPVHHAQPVDGGHRGDGRGTRPRRAGVARTQYRKYRQRLPRPGSPSSSSPSCSIACASRAAAPSSGADPFTRSS